MSHRIGKTKKHFFVSLFLKFVWDNGMGEYATRRGTFDVRVFSKMFKERQKLQLSYPAEGIFGGNLLTVRSSEFVCFYDWENLQLIRRIDVAPKQVYWSTSDLVVLATDTSFYILNFDREAFEAELDRADGQVGPVRPHLDFGMCLPFLSHKR